MNRTSHREERFIRKLNTAEQLIAQGKTVADGFRVIEVTQPKHHRLRQYGGMQAEAATRLTQLEKVDAASRSFLQKRSWRRLCSSIL